MNAVCPNEALRTLVSTALVAINAENGGRYMSAVATMVGVDRTTVGRWRRGTVTPSVEQCRRLSARFPNHFDHELLLRLHAQHALGDHDAGEYTVGIRAALATSDVYLHAADALREDPVAASDREILLSALHLDHSPGAVTAADEAEEIIGNAVRKFQRGMTKRSREGWRVRVVTSAGHRSRFSGIRSMLDQIEGPDVEIRAYPRSLPLTICPLVIARRDVSLAFDDSRTAMPAESLMLRSPAAVSWARNYFERLFLDAPFTLRGVRGVNKSAWRQFQDDVESRQHEPLPA